MQNVCCSGSACLSRNVCILYEWQCPGPVLAFRSVQPESSAISTLLVKFFFRTLEESTYTAEAFSGILKVLDHKTELKKLTEMNSSKPK